LITKHPAHLSEEKDAPNLPIGGIPGREKVTDVRQATGSQEAVHDGMTEDVTIGMPLQTLMVGNNHSP
jgi:hypothetical protein